MHSLQLRRRLHGAIFGCMIGHCVFDLIADPIIWLYSLSKSLRTWVFCMQRNILECFYSNVHPNPIQGFCLSGRFFSVPFISFLLASIIGGGLRYYAVAWVSRRYGPRVAEKCIKYFNQITIVFVAPVLMALIFFFEVFNLFT